MFLDADYLSYSDLAVSDCLEEESDVVNWELVFWELLWVVGGLGFERIMECFIYYASLTAGLIGGDSWERVVVVVVLAVLATTVSYVFLWFIAS